MSKESCIKSKSLNDDFSILVNTCDSYEDCWDPFFTLFKYFWPEYHGKIYLNTEKKDYSFNDLDIIPVKCSSGSKGENQEPWGKRLRAALEMIDDDTILYLHEDYFFKDFVKNDLVSRYARLIDSNESIHCIHLTDQSLIAESDPSEYEGLFLALLNQRYRTCLQASFWKKEVLLQYLRDEESGWEFEEFGSRRGLILKHNFYVVDNHWVKLNEFEIIPYIFTGITQGKWHKDVPDLFEQHSIRLNYNLRGIYRPGIKDSMEKRIFRFIKRIPVHARFYFDLISMKYSKKM
ncbi:hypothetical protein LCM02_09330 [Lutimonas saemankumensis]|uniref:hypothetical protein n=1 Tax=Lutimonas saemankumensis TaxID=483016 RepID=UPI001CD3D0D8|nr:hypothetical protein [Lutimonas saemankumensis]MCA0932652.1 hypothetical protein [Lutimonas saemankumensis]